VRAGECVGASHFQPLTIHPTAPLPLLFTHTALSRGKSRAAQFPFIIALSNGRWTAQVPLSQVVHTGASVPGDRQAAGAQAAPPPAFQQPTEHAAPPPGPSPTPAGVAGSTRSSNRKRNSSMEKGGALRSFIEDLVTGGGQRAAGTEPSITATAPSGAWAAAAAEKPSGRGQRGAGGSAEAAPPQTKPASQTDDEMRDLLDKVNQMVDGFGGGTQLSSSQVGLRPSVLCSNLKVPHHPAVEAAFHVSIYVLLLAFDPRINKPG